jgi:4-alpha-glucanotransferase
MTSTHDLPTVAGWWRGTDIETRAVLGLYGDGNDGSAERTQRSRERGQLWDALTRSDCAEGRQPPSGNTTKIVTAASRFIARTPSRLALLPLEDLVGEEQQPNLPATSNEHPNWRQRQKAPAAQLLGAPKVVARLRAMKSERGQR